eukprot:scaffold96944_cov36-Phaeocystis_antarctica.AAC.1
MAAPSDAGTTPPVPKAFQPLRVLPREITASTFLPVRVTSRAAAAPPPPAEGVATSGGQSGLGGSAAAPMSRSHSTMKLSADAAPSPLSPAQRLPPCARGQAAPRVPRTW